jgi:hypothetical protein
MREPKKDSKQSSCTCPPKGPEPEHSDARPPRRTLTSDEARKLAGDGLGAERIAFFQRKSSTFVDELNSAGCRHCGARSPLAAGRELYGKPHLLALEIPELFSPKIFALAYGRPPGQTGGRSPHPRAQGHGDGNLEDSANHRRRHRRRAAGGRFKMISITHDKPSGGGP